MRKTFGFVLVTIAIAGLVSAADSNRAVPSEYKSLMDKIGERLIVISETAQERDGKQTQELVKTLESVDKALAQHAPDNQLKTAQQRSGSLIRLSMEGAAKASLGSIRANLAIYYGDQEGDYPKSLSELVPKYLSEIPKLELPDHPAGNEVIIVKEAKADGVELYLKDTGKWLYFTDRDSIPLYGNLVIDCSHKDSKGKTWFQY